MMAASQRTLQRCLPLLVVVVFSTSVWAGCRRTGSTTTPDDAGVPVSHRGDAAGDEDAGTSDDAGDSDAGVDLDAGDNDAGQGDAGLSDAGTDGGPGDAGTTSCAVGQTQPCSVCNRAGTETCQAGGVWGSCQTPQAPPCFPNQQRNCTSACGNAGTQTCSDTCAWDACEPAIFEECSRPSLTRACGTDMCGTTGLQTCSASCTWGSCVTSPDTCTPSTVRSCRNICGNAGTQSCSDNCGWGICEGGSLGSCVPSAIISCEDSCGNYGVQTCGSTCEWGACDSGFTCALDSVEVPASTDGTVFCGKVDGGFQGCTETAGDHCATSCCGDQIGITAGQADGGSFCFSTRYLIRFPHLADAVPVGSTVTKVELIVSVLDAPRDACNFQAAALKTVWDNDAVNWNTTPATTTGTSRAGPADPGPYSIDVTTDALAMIRGTQPENGWVIRSPSDADCLVNPSHYTTDCNITLPSICQTPSLDSFSWPRLLIKYRP